MSWTCSGAVRVAHQSYPPAAALAHRASPSKSVSPLTCPRTRGGCCGWSVRLRPELPWQWPEQPIRASRHWTSVKAAAYNFPDVNHCIRKSPMKKPVLSTAFMLVIAAATAQAQEGASGTFKAGDPLGATNEAGTWTPLSSNVKIYGALRYAESCTF